MVERRNWCGENCGDYDDLLAGIKRLRAIVRLADMLIQPDTDGPVLVGHRRFREALHQACRNDLKTPDNLGELVDQASQDEAKLAHEAKLDLYDDEHHADTN